MITSAFTCTGPYAILILMGVKRVENRSAWPVPREGRCAISCSKKFCKEEYGNFVQWASQTLSAADFERMPSWSDVKDWPGRIVGACGYRARVREELDDAAEAASTFGAWDEGYEVFWELSEVTAFDTPIDCRGNTGMWQMPEGLARRVTLEDALAQSIGSRVATAEDAARLFRLAMPLAGVNEGLFVLPLDAESCVLEAPRLVSLGDPTTTVVDPRDVFAAALRADAKSFILAHNHPSGDLTPSIQDRALTSDLKVLAPNLGLRLVDHLVVGGWDSSVAEKDAYESLMKG